MTAIFPGWMVLKQLVVEGQVLVLLWRSEAGTLFYCLIRHRGTTKGGWHYRSRWSAEYALDAWDGATPPMAGEWKDFEARA